MSDDRPPSDPKDRTAVVRVNLFTDADTGALRARRYQLVVIKGPEKGREVRLEGGTLLVGTHANNDLVLTDPTVSRYHLEISVRQSGVHIRDLDTTNGTFCGGTRLGSVTVEGVARVKVGGNTELEILPEDEPIEVAPWTGSRFGAAIGEGPSMQRLFALLARVADTDVTVLLEGETGTGKELLAEGIHEHSPRAKGPFVVVDCGAIPRDLIQSELFGHVRGAFTGATQNKLGLIEAADGGTLFLDEIGELPLELQPQLLRVLEKRELRRVGETKPKRVDIRVVAATHRDLGKMVAAGSFREDLYFRLAVVRALVPPLRDRIEDLPVLARAFVERMGRGGFELGDATLAELSRYAWPGNVRELRNVVEQALSMGVPALSPAGAAGAGQGVRGGSGPVPALTLGEPGLNAPGGSGAPGARSPSMLAPTASSGARDVLELPFKEAKGALVEAFEREYITALLERHKGNISRAAQDAGIDRNYIHRLVKKYGLAVDRE